MKIILMILFTVKLIFSVSINLTPNNSFFSPKGTLKLYGESAVVDEFNGDKHYGYIGGWKNVADTIVWGLKGVSSGDLFVELFLSVPLQQNNSIAYVYVGNEKKSFVLKSTSNMDTYVSQAKLLFSIPSKELLTEIKVKIKDKQSGSVEFARIEKLVLSGSAINNANVWKRRWRPLAGHAKFYTDDDDSTEVSVYEINVITRNLWSYQVMSTEFGYLGAPMDNGVFTGINFSLWSFSANSAPPAHYQLSHLISVGSDGYFGFFGGEGTGVKVRGYNPYDNIDTAKCVIALRKKSGLLYNTYWSYFFDPITKHWKLYACGKTYNKKAELSYMAPTGGFLEVAGPPATTRTGHRVRKVEFCGWRKNIDGSWHTITKMEHSSNDASLSFKSWGQNSTGTKFILKIGGFNDMPQDEGTVVLDAPLPLPYYLKNDYDNELYLMPSIFENKKVSDVLATSAVVNYDIINCGTNATAKLYYGTKKGLTEGITEDSLIDTYWENSVNVGSVKNGLLSIPIGGLKPRQKYFYRLRLKNKEGTTWAFNSDSLVTESTTALTTQYNEKDLFQIFPNPAIKKVSFRFKKTYKKIKIEIENINGMLMKNNEFFNEHYCFIDFTFGKGLYFVTVFADDEVFKKSIVITK